MKVYKIKHYSSVSRKVMFLTIVAKSIEEANKWCDEMTNEVDEYYVEGEIE